MDLIIHAWPMLERTANQEGVNTVVSITPRGHIKFEDSEGESFYSYQGWLRLYGWMFDPNAQVPAIPKAQERS